nr:hypothetical protein [Variovorax paradoxus]
MASAVTSDVDPVGVAAMVSSIVAISSVVSEEARLGRHKSVIVQTESGFAVFCSVYRRDVELVINVLARDTTVLALVAYPRPATPRSRVAKSILLPTVLPPIAES